MYCAILIQALTLDVLSWFATGFLPAAANHINYPWYTYNTHIQSQRIPKTTITIITISINQSINQSIPNDSRSFSVHEYTGRGWASVLNTHLSNGYELVSSNRRYRYFNVSAKNQLKQITRRLTLVINNSEKRKRKREKSTLAYRQVFGNSGHWHHECSYNHIPYVYVSRWLGKSCIHVLSI